MCNAPPKNGEGKTFSILERIDVGETTAMSSAQREAVKDFQYPRTDRRG